MLETIVLACIILLVVLNASHMGFVLIKKCYENRRLNAIKNLHAAAVAAKT